MGPRLNSGDRRARKRSRAGAPLRDPLISPLASYCTKLATLGTLDSMRIVILVFAASACMLQQKGDGTGPFELSVPSGVQGSVLVTFENDTYGQICGMRMW